MSVSNLIERPIECGPKLCISANELEGSLLLNRDQARKLILTLGIKLGEVRLLDAPVNPTPEEFLKAMGERIKVVRKKLGLIQQELADRSGHDRAYISAIEHGKHNVTIGAVLKLANALGVSFQALTSDSTL